MQTFTLYTANAKHRKKGSADLSETQIHLQEDVTVYASLSLSLSVSVCLSVSAQKGGSGHQQATGGEAPVLSLHEWQEKQWKWTAEEARGGQRRKCHCFVVTNDGTVAMLPNQRGWQCMV